MFYVIALAGAHKKVIKQLREQLEMVGLLKSRWLCFISFNFVPHSLFISHHLSYYLNADLLVLPQEGRDKRFLIQRLCQAQKQSAVQSPAPKSQPRSSSSSCSFYHTSFSNNFNESVFLAHPPPDSATHV